MSITLNITPQFIEVHSTDNLTQAELFDVLNSIEGDDADAIFEVMPKDYDYIMNQEKYGVLFAHGSPQICECGWKFEYSTDSVESVLKVSGFR